MTISTRYDYQLISLPYKQLLYHIIELIFHNYCFSRTNMILNLTPPYRCYFATFQCLKWRNFCKKHTTHNGQFTWNVGFRILLDAAIWLETFIPATLDMILRNILLFFPLEGENTSLFFLALKIIICSLNTVFSSSLLKICCFFTQIK